MGKADPGSFFAVNEHYFTHQPRASHRLRSIRFTLGRCALELWTDRGVFSYRRVDPGTRLLAGAFRPEGARRAVDLGAGYGALGLMLAARFSGLEVVLVEINQRAARLARHNAAVNGLPVPVVVGDGLQAFCDASVDAVVTNPPVRAGRHVIYRWMAEARRVLTPGGRLWLVIRTRQGAASLARALEQRLGPVELVERGGGYRVFCARRVAESPPNSAGAHATTAEEPPGASDGLGRWRKG